MTPDQLTRVRDLAVKQGLRHLAMDAQAAIDGCPHSLEAVDEWLADNHLFEMACLYTNETETMARPAESYCLGRAA